MSAPHTATTAPGERIPGTWRWVCSCGATGALHGGSGARAAARREGYDHEFTAEERSLAFDACNACDACE